MRYLKSYKIFENTENRELEIAVGIMDDLETICYDITDDGRLSVVFGSRKRKQKYDPQDIQFEPEMTHILCISVKDTSDNSGFYINDIKDTLLRIKEYLGKRYQGCSLREVDVEDRCSIGLTNFHLNMYSECPLQDIYITYTVPLFINNEWVVESVMKDANTHIQTLEDILLDLKDDGCYISVSPTPLAMASGIEPDIYVRINDDGIVDSGFRSSQQIYPPFYAYYTRMVSYMESVGWGHEIVKTSRGQMEIRFSRK